VARALKNAGLVVVLLGQVSLYAWLLTAVVPVTVRGQLLGTAETLLLGGVAIAVGRAVRARRHRHRGRHRAGRTASARTCTWTMFLVPDRRGYLDGETLTVPGGLGANNATAGEPSDHLQATPRPCPTFRPPARRAGFFGQLLTVHSPNALSPGPPAAATGPGDGRVDGVSWVTTTGMSTSTSDRSGPRCIDEDRRSQTTLRNQVGAHRGGRDRRHHRHLVRQPLTWAGCMSRRGSRIGQRAGTIAPKMSEHVAGRPSARLAMDAAVDLARPLDLPVLPLTPSTAYDQGPFVVVGWGAQELCARAKPPLPAGTGSATTDQTPAAAASTSSWRPWRGLPRQHVRE
jgi:hypothetical protein